MFNTIIHVINIIFILYFYFLHKIVYLDYRRFNVSFTQGGTCVPCPPFSVSAVSLCCRIPDITLGVVGGGLVDAGDLGVWGSGLVVGALACLPEEVDPWSILPHTPVHHHQPPMLYRVYNNTRTLRRQRRGDMVHMFPLE